MNTVKHVDKMGPLHKNQTETLMYPSETNDSDQLKHSHRICSVFVKKTWQMITECEAMHDQTEKMVRLISFFTLHAQVSIRLYFFLFSGLQHFI